VDTVGADFLVGDVVGGVTGAGAGAGTAEDGAGVDEASVATFSLRKLS
jgi:hypothetical protein